MFSKQTKRKTWLSRIGPCLVLLTIWSISVMAQDITSGTIQGTVSDEQSAVVPGATVEAKNVGTNFSKSFTTDSDGRFTFLSMPTGRYVVTVTKGGFSKLIQENVELTVGRLISLNIALKVSGVSGVVTVTTTPTIDTGKTESSSTINETSITNTPILGRKFEDLLTLTPGVSITQGPDGDEINFAGQRGIFNNVSLDGGDYNNGFFGEQAGGQRAAIDIALDAVKEFQVIPTGANAEYGRTAGGIINVITKSGTNDVHGSLFHYQRLEGLTSNTSDGKSLTDFHREQFGGTIGGPIKRDKAFYFFGFEGIRENLTRANLSAAIGTPCSSQAPTVQANEALINGSADCQRRALLTFMQASRNQNEGLPVDHAIRNFAFLGKIDANLSTNNKLSVTYNFDHSKNTNQTFDVATYGNSANGTEGPSKINVVNVNLFTTFSSMIVNEGHFSYSREVRPRAANTSNIPADTALGFATTFRFGHPFFLQPGVDETFWRSHIRDSLSVVSGRHTIKFGGEWLHSLNDQVFQGFFQGRYRVVVVFRLRFTVEMKPDGWSRGKWILLRKTLSFTRSRLEPNTWQVDGKIRVKLKESIIIAATTDTVWKHLADPNTWRHWNTKVKVVRRDRSGELDRSEQFSAQLRIQKREVASQIAVSKCTKGAKLELVQNFEDSKGRRMVRVKFRLTSVRQGTRVSQEVDLGRSGVSLLSRTLIVVLHKLGKAEEVSPLEKLKLLIEGLSDKSAEIPA